MSSPQPPLTPLEAHFTTLLHRRRTRSLLRRLTTAAPGTADFSSNDYLSLSTHPAIHAAFLTLLQGGTPGTPTPLGSRGSRLLDGNHPLATQLEPLIARHHRARAGLLFNSGYDANAGLFAALPQPGDVVVHDELIHASVHDGARLSRAGRRVAFAHNDVAALRDVLAGLGPEVRAGRGRSVFVAVEAVYSMDGDVAPLAEVVAAVEEGLPAGNGYVVVDEAHATGVVGEGGRGLTCELGLEGRVFARVVTFGKALGGSGAIVLSSPITRDYLINYARSLIYTTALPYPTLASIKATYDFMIAGHTEPLLQSLHSLIHRTHALLLSLSTSHPRLIQLNPLPATPSPIIPIFTPNPRSLAAHCQRSGYMVRAIVPPTVPAGSERVRVCLHAGNTVAEVERLVGAVRGWVELQEEKEKESQQEEVRLEERSAAGGVGQGSGAVLEKARL
ncbi:8-amino-7-oxononanoate synthase [Neofusicoccum parvum]|uniref:8-amino-7-oxononanoate synthase n=1 Tax=Neofusicoccum parvum TaxID=310453 RepID=A0ACB5RZA2_9PEZI|nr:8-amino-7-oxononanoate synthase [Neofusicoccum parvum]